MNKIKLISIDLDGTLLDSNKRISDNSYEKLREIQKQGVIVVISTARHIEECSCYTKEFLLNGTGYISTCDGQYVYDSNLSILHTFKMLEASDVKRIINLYNNERISFYTSMMDYTINRNLSIAYKAKCYVVNHFVKDKRQIKIINTTALDSFSEHIEKIKVYNAVIKDEINKKYTCISLEHSNLEIGSKERDKVNAIKWIAQYHDINDDNILVFGDDNNDIKSLSYFKNSYAMKNATAAAKKAAKNMTCSNDEEGVLQVLNKLFR